jgi:hypothetical protein
MASRGTRGHEKGPGRERLKGRPPREWCTVVEDAASFTQTLRRELEKK